MIAGTHPLVGAQRRSVGLATVVRNARGIYAVSGAARCHPRPSDVQVHRLSPNIPARRRKWWKTRSPTR